MRLRDLRPWRDFVIETRLAPNMASAELEKLVGAGGPFIHKPSSGRERRFCRRISYRNSFLPMIGVVVEPSPTGARVRISMRLHVFVMAFMTLWMTGATLGCLAMLTVGLRQQNPIALFALVFPLFGAALVSIPFALEARIAEDLLREPFAGPPKPGEPYR
jgi:hypothetical protein